MSFFSIDSNNIAALIEMQMSCVAINYLVQKN